MTKLQAGKSIKRETLALDRHRPITVTLLPYYCLVAVKGSREFYSVDYGALLDLGRKLDFMAKERKRLPA